MDPRKILTRHPEPILDPEDYPGIHSLFNPAVCRHDGEYKMLVSVCKFSGRAGGRETRLATSRDGIRFELADEPFFTLDAEPEPICNFGGIIDNRLSKIGDTYYILAPCGVDEHGHEGCVTLMYKTKDFKTAEFVEVLTLPHNRGSSIFPEKINGRYYRLDRPGERGSGGSIWISESPDLIHWGRFRPWLEKGYSIWNEAKIGPTPGIKTSAGWLVLTHGVSEPCDGTHYCIGAALADLDDPGRLLGWTQSYLLAPETAAERHGAVDNVVFVTGGLADEATDELRIYYGCADNRIGLCTGSLSATIEACLKKL